MIYQENVCSTFIKQFIDYCVAAHLQPAVVYNHNKKRNKNKVVAFFSVTPRCFFVFVVSNL